MTSNDPPLRVMVVDDNPIVRTGLVSVLELRGVDIAAEASDGAQAIRLTDTLRPDVVLLDVRMPGIDGVTAAQRLSETSKVLMLTYTDDPTVIRTAIGNGAVGYLVHGTFSSEDLYQAVNEAARGGNPLSPKAATALVGAVREAPVRNDTRNETRFGLSCREVEVMDLIAQGRSNSEIAQDLFLSSKTVKNHVNHIYAKLSVTARAAAIARWLGTAPGIRDEA